jgi:rhodanese-related sulfurtransferase
MGPFHLTADWGTWVSYLVPLVIGMGFGAALEMSGFGDSRKLAAQFYFKDVTVLKVMFTGIVVAGTLIGLSSAVGLLDFQQVFVNPTYLAPGIVGGLIMGVGFIIGGFCPGTSLVAASTLKIDGIVFALGVAFGIFVFGETVGAFDGFFNATAMGRFTLPELFGIDTGLVLLGVVAMALFMFLGGEVLEDLFGRGVPARDLRFLPRRPMAWVFGGVLFAVAGAAAIVGQPSADRRWELQAAELQPRLEDRAVYVHPMEVAELTQDTAIYVRVLDLRPQRQFNWFHLRNATRVTLDRLRDPAYAKSLKALPANTVLFTVSNDDVLAAEGWRLLAAQGVPNVYVVEGGINRWLTIFPPPPCLAAPRSGPRAVEDPAFAFFRSVGDCCNSAYPEVKHKQLPVDCYLGAHPDSAAHSGAGTRAPDAPEVPFERKVQLQKKAAVRGGCS